MDFFIVCFFSIRGWRKGEFIGRFNDIIEEFRVFVGGWCQDFEYVVNFFGVYVVRFDIMDIGVSFIGSFFYYLQENKIYLLIFINICLGGLL